MANTVSKHVVIMRDSMFLIFSSSVVSLGTGLRWNQFLCSIPASVQSNLVRTRFVRLRRYDCPSHRLVVLPNVTQTSLPSGMSGRSLKALSHGHLDAHPIRIGCVHMNAHWLDAHPIESTSWGGLDAHSNRIALPFMIHAKLRLPRDRWLGWLYSLAWLMARVYGSSVLLL